VTLGSAWTGGPETDYYWIVPGAALAQLIPNFFVSWWLEALVARGSLPEFERRDVRYAIFWANIASYAMLAACIAALLAYAIATH